jgi:endonuclease G
MPAANLDTEMTLESMTRLGDIVAPGMETLEKAGREPTTPAEELADREGYDEDFLSGWKVTMPKLTGATAKDVRRLPGNRGHELKYTHFSVVLSATRRMPIYTVVNIDGEESLGIKRTPVPWAYDGRLPKDQQWGDALYDNNALDRGHMVRREDPVWGKRPVAKAANVDTFHFTNSCPQMAGVNQQTWLGLENYILQHARADGSRVTVFTGPFFSEKDLPYRDALVPLAFWKVVAIVREDGRRSATAYKVSQEKELADLEFVYAGYKTFQISIQQVSDATGIDFSELARHDGFSQHERTSGEPMVERLDTLENIRV